METGDFMCKYINFQSCKCKCYFFVQIYIDLRSFISFKFSFSILAGPQTITFPYYLILQIDLKYTKSH